MEFRTTWRRTVASSGAALMLTLAGCGGGGGGGGDSAPAVVGPPTTAATLVASTAEAAVAAQAMVGAAGRVVQLDATLGQGAVPIGGGVASPLSRAPSTREQAMLRETVGCAAFVGIPGCTGSVTVDTNLAENSNVATAGSYLTLIFGNVQATFGGQSLSLNGSMRVDFLTSLDLTSLNFANQRLQLTFDALSGSDNGVSFGPLTLAALVEFDAQSLSTTTIDGLRLSRLENATVIDAGNYTLANVALRLAGWSSSSAYIDVEFANWTVANARPVLGATATVRAGNNSIAFRVAGSTSTTVSYNAVFMIDGVATTYSVTATYPQGGGAPSYTAVRAGT